MIGDWRPKRGGEAWTWYEKRNLRKLEFVDGNIPNEAKWVFAGQAELWVVSRVYKGNQPQSGEDI